MYYDILYSCYAHGVVSSERIQNHVANPNGFLMMLFTSDSLPRTVWDTYSAKCQKRSSCLESKLLICKLGP